jgi:hypothetical protein
MHAYVCEPREGIGNVGGASAAAVRLRTLYSILNVNQIQRVDSRVAIVGAGAAVSVVGLLRAYGSI